MGIVLGFHVEIISDGKQIFVQNYLNTLYYVFM